MKTDKILFTMLLLAAAVTSAAQEPVTDVQQKQETQAEDIQPKQETQSEDVQQKQETQSAEQSPTDGVRLKELTVDGARVVSKADGQVIYLTDAMRSSATSGYSLLRDIALAGLRVDEPARSVTSLDRRGDVQIRINGIIAGQDELLALDCRAVQRIEYTDRPGLRYGEGVAHVINFIVRRATGGYTLGTDLTDCLTSARGDNSLFARMNRGKSQWEATYGMGYTVNAGVLADMTARYELPDGGVRTLTATDDGSSTRRLSHRGGLTYSRVDSGRNVLQVKVAGDMTREPYRHQTSRKTYDGVGYTTEANSRNRSWSAATDVYWQLEAGRHQTLTANVVATTIATDYAYFDNDGGRYAYAVDGRTWSVTGEAIYENRLKPFTLTAGLQWQTKHTDNRYTGDAAADATGVQHTAYVFAQLAGRLGPLAYTAGMGMSRVRFRRPPYSDTFTMARPKMSLSLPLGSGLRLSYDIELSQHVSGIANTNGVTLRRNLMEMERGNPDLRPNRVVEQTAKLTFSDRRLTAQAVVFYKQNHRPNLAAYDRETDAQGNTTFIYTQRNQPGCDLLMTQLYANFDIIPKRLSVMGYGGLFRCFNYGDDYRHFHTAFNGGCSLTAWLGAWTLAASADNGFGWMEGEHRGRQGAMTDLSVGYRVGTLNLRFHWQQPFRTDVRDYHGVVDSRFVWKDMSTWCRNDANRLTLTVTYTFSRGRRYHDIDRTMENRDRDAGVMK